MELPVQITFRNVPQSDAVEAYARERADKLDHFFQGIMRCHVVIDAPHRHQRQGAKYDVRIDITVPRDELVVSRNVGSLAHEDVYACIDQAFDDAQRLLEDYARRRRQDVKRHEASPHGRVAYLAHYEGYGYLETNTGERVYFHRNSVLNGAFDRLDVGDPVRFVAEDGLQGPQASTVELLPRAARKRRRARSQMTGT
jgi:ribosomal subunit interface protein